MVSCDDFSGCNVIAYCFLFVVAGAIYLFFKTWQERKQYMTHEMTAE
jgi:hypothetical protein